MDHMDNSGKVSTAGTIFLSAICCSHGDHHVDNVHQCSVLNVCRVDHMDNRGKWQTVRHDFLVDTLL